MILDKLIICNAKGQVLNRLAATTQPYSSSLQIIDDDILSIQVPANKTSGISFMQYDIEPWKLSIKYDSLSTVLNTYGHPENMDQTGLLWQYMIYIVYDTVTYPVFVQMSSIDWSTQQNYIKFNAYSISGVVFLYGKQNPVIIKDVQVVQAVQQPIPRKLKLYCSEDHNGHIVPYNYNFSSDWNDLRNNHIKYFTSIVGTAIVNIFTRNNEGQQYTDYWAYSTYQHSTLQLDAFKYYLCTYSKLNQKYFTRLQSVDFSNALQSGNYLVNMINEAEWKNQLVDKFDSMLQNFYPSGLNVHLIDLNADVQLQYFQDDYTVFGNRVVIDYVQDARGETFDQIYTKLVDAGYFTYSGGNTPYMLQVYTDPGDIEAFQPVIGVFLQRPNWLASTHDYYFRFPGNDNKKRSLKLQYTMYLVGRYKQYITAELQYAKYKVYKRTASLNIDLNQPNFYTLLEDTGWESESLTELTAFDNPLDGWKHIVYGTQINDYSDYFLRYNCSLSGKTYYSIIVNGAINSIRIASTAGNVIYNHPAYIDAVSIINKSEEELPDGKQWQGISNIDLIKQSMILLNSSIIYSTKNGNTIYTPKIKGIGFPTDFNLIYTIAQDDVQKYKYIPFIKTKAQNIYTYGVIEQNKGYNQMVRSLYNEIMKGLNVKITINIIGDVTDSLNMIDYRYFYFQNKTFLLTSVGYDPTNNITNIQGFGK